MRIDSNTEIKVSVESNASSGANFSSRISIQLEKYQPRIYLYFAGSGQKFMGITTTNLSSNGKLLSYADTSDGNGRILLILFRNLLSGNVTTFTDTIDILEILRDLCHIGTLSCNLYIQNYSYSFPLGLGKGTIDLKAKSLPLSRKCITKSATYNMEYPLYHRILNEPVMTPL